MQPRNIHYPGAQGVILPEGSSADRDRKVERAAQPAGCSTTARAEEDGPVIWETLSVLCESQSSTGRLKRGEPELETKRSGESEGRIGALTLGNVVARGPRRAKAARAGVNLRRGT